MPKKSGDAPLVSVIIPVWNAENNIEKLIDDLFRQTYSNIEIIAIDDGSSDDSLRVLKRLAKKDPRLHVEHQENAGVSATRNRGIELAKGEYLAFVDSDDRVMPEFIGAMIEAMQENQRAALALTGMRYNKLREGKAIDLYMQPRRQRRPGEPMSNYMVYLMILDGRMYGVAGKIFRTEIVKQNRIWVEEGRDFAEDTKFTMDYLAAAKDGKIVFIPKPLYVYNFGTETSIVRKSSTDWENWRKSYLEMKDWVRRDGDGRLSLRARALLMLIYLRWRIGHFRSKRRAKR